MMRDRVISDTGAAGYSLDISGETCPMTYVRTRLALDRMQPGETLSVRLRGDDAERNVPANAIRQGHAVLRSERNDDGSLTVLIRRA